MDAAPPGTDRAELDALLERQLVMLEHGAPGRRRAYLTKKGRSILRALGANIASRRSHGSAAERGGQYEAPVARADEAG
ncbi:MULTISPECIES: hypothetical protein [Burkholderia]|uniref:hypothetical protein n=1 Tax=Burkholderia TaxID=32008 RepID=UPI001CF2C7E3|nr:MULTISPECIES: hypothetical protein [Burkholderia]MCA8037215.1 hypothetical protein [Burkholderia arboris]MDN7702627.1 hypothetical protein [Burkholderia sp. AU44665]